MSRTVLAALVSIALLALGGVLFVLSVEREGAPISVAPDAGTSPGPDSRFAPPRHGPAASVAPSPSSGTTAVAPEGASPTVDVRRSAAELAGMRREVGAELSRLDPRVLACGLRPTRLLITLESQRGSVRLLHARVAPPETEEPPAGSGPTPERPGARECAVRALEGAVLDAPTATPGRRWEMEYWPGAAR